MMVRITVIAPAGSGKTKTMLRLEEVLTTEGFKLGSMDDLDVYYQSVRSSEERYYEKPDLGGSSKS